MDTLFKYFCVKQLSKCMIFESFSIYFGKLCHKKGFFFKSRSVHCSQSLLRWSIENNISATISVIIFFSFSSFSSFLWSNFFCIKTIVGRNCFGQTFYGPNIFWTEQKLFWPKIFLTKHFLNPKSFWPQIYLTQNLFDPHFFGLKSFCPKNIMTKISLSHKIYCTKFFQTQNFWDSNLIWTKKILDQKLFLTNIFFDPVF